MTIAKPWVPAGMNLEMKAAGVIERMMKEAHAPQTGFSTNYVIEFARVRSNHINSWLNRQLDTMRSGARDSEAINGVLKLFARYSEGFKDDVDGAERQKRLNEIKAALTSAIEDLPEGSPLAVKLAWLRDDPDSRLNLANDTIVTKEEISEVTKDLENELKSIDRRSQEDQLYINQKMGEKNEVMQLAAMLIQQMNETAKSILGRS